MSFTEPIINWAALSPALVVLGGGLLGVLVEAFVPRFARHGFQVFVGVAAILISAVMLFQRWVFVAAGGSAAMAFGLNEDPFAVATQAIVLLIGFLSLLVIADRTQLGDGAFAAQAADRPGSAEEAESLHAGWTTTEVFPLTLLSLGGMMLFGAASDLITLFVLLELVSLPLYIMAATARHRRLLSQEAALKYFVLGAFASAFLLMGAALLYGLSGAVDYKVIAQAVVSGGSGTSLFAITGVALVTIGLLFKTAAVPFHAWSPDVYQGAPTPVTGFMAAGVKACAFFALVRFYYVVGGLLGWDLAVFLWTVAIATMALGTVVGLVQKNIKRMLAYSAIAHAGFMLIGIIAYNQVAIAALMMYALSYGVATVGAFGLISLVRTSHEGAIGGEADDLEAYKGLGRTNPLVAGLMALFLLSFAGIPLTAGFTAKFQLFLAGVQGEATWLVILAVLSSAATACFYMRLIVLMFFHEPDGQTTVVVTSRGMIGATVVMAAGATLLLGLYPQPIITLLTRAAMLLP